MITKMLFVTRRAKMPRQGVLLLPPIKSRRAAKNAIQRIYIKYGNTKTAKMCAVGGQRKRHTYIYRKGILLKVCHVVTKWLQLSGSLDNRRRPMIEWGQSEEVSTTAADD